MQAQLARDTDRLTAAGTAAVPFYDLLSRLIFQASVAALLTPEAADDPALFEAFKVFDQHLPLAAGGFKVRYPLMCSYLYLSTIITTTAMHYYYFTLLLLLPLVLVLLCTTTTCTTIYCKLPITLLTPSLPGVLRPGP